MKKSIFHEVKFSKEYGKVIGHPRIVPSAVAIFAKELLVRWADVSGRLDKEMVARCCDISEEAHAEFERRGWFNKVPEQETQ